MPKLVVTVSRLNRRRVIPSVLPDPNFIAGEVHLNDSFDAEEITVVPNPALGKWYKDRDGYFYWGGGVKIHTASATDITSPAATGEVPLVQKISYKNSIDYLNQSWLTGNGESTTVIVIDTGVSAIASNFNTALISEIDITEARSADKDHGTFIAGLICAKSKEIEGFANDTKLVAIRFKEKGIDLDRILDNMAVALDKVVRLKQINPSLNLCINISQGFKDQQTSMFPEKINLISDLIKTITEMNVMVFCAAGEDMDLFDGNLLFPALLPETISVGCITSEFRNREFSKLVDFITPLQMYRSYYTAQQIVTKAGSSFSVAIIASISLLINSVQTINNKDSFKSILNPFKKDIQDFKFNDSEYEFFINKSS